jgi:DNA-binding HxlR family transcriptional regulator
MKTYGQLCPLAQALDRVGDRWTPLVIRDLAAGPRRYSDLLAGLPGIGTTLLSDRLRRLQEDGLVLRRELPPPAASSVYELTEAGTELLQALVPLAAWGLRFLEEDQDTEVRPEWVLMFLKEGLDREAARSVRDVYEFRVEGHTFHVLVDDGTLSGAMGPSPRTPDVVITASWPALVALGARGADPVALAARGEAIFDGSPEALERCRGLLVRKTPPPWMTVQDDVPQPAAADPSKRRRARRAAAAGR